MSQFTVVAILFLTFVQPSCAEDTSEMKRFLIKLGDHTRLIEEQASVIAASNAIIESFNTTMEKYRHTTEALNKTIQEMEAKMNALKADREGE